MLPEESKATPCDVVKSSAYGWPAISVPRVPNLPVPSDNGCNTRCHFNHDMVICVANVEVTTPKSKSRQVPQACAGGSARRCQKIWGPPQRLL